MAFEVDFMDSFDLDSIAAELRRVAKKLGKRTLTWRDIDVHARVGAYTVRMKFGSMPLAHEAAGLVPPRARLTNNEILRLLSDLWKTTLRESGRSPYSAELKKYGVPVSLKVVITRFGSWHKALKATALTSPGRLARRAPVMAIRDRPLISDRKRFLVFKRDKYRCRICRRVGGELELDHVIPVCRGGNGNTDNLQTLCRKCNRGKAGDLQ